MTSSDGPAWSVERTGPVTHTIRVPYNRSKDWEFWVLISSDRHYDHPDSQLPMQNKHLNQALGRNAAVIDIGDLFCGMQGPHDSRQMKGDTRVEHNNPDYFGSVVRGAFSFFEPYKDTLAILGRGNHETGVIKHNGFDMTRMLVDLLRLGGSPVRCGGYRGWVRFLFELEKCGGGRRSILLYYTHGSGGDAPVTKGVIKHNRRAVYLPDADIIISGHNHNSWIVENPRARLNALGEEYQSDQYHVNIPTYKQEFIGKDGGFHHEKEGPPKPLGAYWLKFTCCKSEDKVYNIVVETMRAK